MEKRDCDGSEEVLVDEESKRDLGVFSGDEEVGGRSEICPCEFAMIAQCLFMAVTALDMTSSSTRELVRDSHSVQFLSSSSVAGCMTSLELPRLAVSSNKFGSISVTNRSHILEMDIRSDSGTKSAAVLWTLADELARSFPKVVRFRDILAILLVLLNG